MADKVIDKLSKICAMLASPHDGERASAALLATQILGDLGITWQQLVFRALSEEEDANLLLNFDKRTPGWHRPYCVWLLTNRFDHLNDWEIEFLDSLAMKYGHVLLTEKQVKALEKVAGKHGLKIAPQGEPK